MIETLLLNITKMLTERKVLLDKNITSSDAWVCLYDDTMASLRFLFRNKKLSSAEILNIFSEKNFWMSSYSSN